MKKSKGKRSKNKIDDEKIEKTKQYKIKASKRGKNKKEKKKKKKNIFLRILKWLFIIGFILALLCGIAGVGIVVGIFTSDKYKVTDEDFKQEFGKNSQVYYKDGTYKTEIAGDEKRREITIEEMGEYIPKAFVAIEDERFYSHQGIDIKRTFGAAVKFITSKGKSTFGGSTITQQLIKNIYEDKADEGAAGVERKIREMARAYNLEKIWSKDQILERYLNYIYMGGYSKNIMGVEMASEYYFNKQAKDVTLAEAAFLAGINNTPNSYYPFSESTDNSELIKTRTCDVLWKMKEIGYIESEEDYNNAIKEAEEGLKFSEGKIASDAKYSYLTAAALNQAIEKLAEEKGWTTTYAKNKIYSGGYKIYTTEDKNIQEILENEAKRSYYVEQPRETEVLNGQKVLKNKGHTQGSMTIIDHTNGQVVACVGALGEDADVLGLNRATSGRAQPGSSIKPLACTAPALEKKIITAGTVYDDVPTSFGSYSPGNSGGYNGLISIRTALAQSSNVVHVKIMREVGPANSIEFMKNFGLEIDKAYESLPLALGVSPVTTLEMAAAYATIANGGVYIEPTFFTKIEDADGNLVLEAKQETKRAMSVENAYILSVLLTAPVTSGTATSCAISGMDVAGKTGSTNGWKDRWLCGFSPYYAAAAWYGFDRAEKPASGANKAQTMWGNVMKAAHKGLASKRFTKPNNNIIYAKICLDSGCSATESCTRTTSELFVKGTVPKACQGHKKANICKETGKLANEYCKDIEEKTFLVKPPKEELKLWNSNYGDKYNDITETCDVHKKPEEKEVTMINAVGKKIEKAKEELEALKLIVTIEYKENKDKEEGIVLEQSVKEKDKIKEGTKIKLTVNKKASAQNPSNPEEKPGQNTEKPSVNTNTENVTNN